LGHVRHGDHDHADHQSSHNALRGLASIGAAIWQRAKAMIAALSRALGVHLKTLAKRRKRQTVKDRKTGPKDPRSTILSTEQNAMVFARRRHTRLPKPGLRKRSSILLWPWTESANLRCYRWSTTDPPRSVQEGRPGPAGNLPWKCPRDNARAAIPRRIWLCAYGAAR